MGRGPSPWFVPPPQLPVTEPATASDSCASCRMAPPKISKKRVNAAITAMEGIGFQRENVLPVLVKLLKLFDYQWEHIEAENFRVLADAILEKSESNSSGQKNQSPEKKNLRSDRSNKKPKINHHSGKPASEMNGNDKRDMVETPLQQEEGNLSPRTVFEGNGNENELQLSSALVVWDPSRNQDEDMTCVPQVLQSNEAGSLPPYNVMIVHGICSTSNVAGVGQSTSNNMQIIEQQLGPYAKGPAHDVNDITKGQECVKIPIVSGDRDGILPPPFHYLRHNTTFQNAHVNLSIARIGDESCCADCFGDCLAQPLPCACARETGGEFAYRRDGLLKAAFLDSCISMLREPDKHPKFYCKICPLERVKLEVNSDSSNVPDPCKGHLIRKFVKECWSKCSCARKCGNRVVQRGISRQLQVFLTPGNKGWGLRAAEELPRGAFVCEYVGEILTNIELYERTMQRTGNARHTYPLLLDADWGTEGFLKDEHALCLDGTVYGNVARFINHRCFDANIIGIPVEIETPDHHYYHLAFFTTREIEPFEELTWDYGIDFDDVNHPIKAFKCHCGSEFCRDKRNISRSKSRALVPV